MDLDTPGHKFTEILENYNKNVPEDEQLPLIRLHDLRHTSATLMISEKVDIETVAHRLGHSKPSVTMNVYGHWLKEKDDQAADVLEKMFG